MMEKVPAALILVVCLVMLLRLVLGERRRATFDAYAREAWEALATMPARLLRWRGNRRRAAEMARDAIRRASAAPEVRRDGNVYHPESFREPRKPH
jgi:hypothetical protein